MSAKNKQPSGAVLAGEILSGLTAAFAVSPLNVVIDKSVVLYANGKSNLWQSTGKELKKLIFTPKTFINSFQFKWMYFVYSFTYTFSNLADYVNLTDSVSHPIQKLLIVFAVNTTASLIKDKKYIQHFGLEAKKFPIKSYGFLFSRDLLAMASAFTLPPLLAKMIKQKTGLGQTASERIAQLTCPLGIQFFATPLHLLGLDYYNRVDATDRLANLRKLYFNSLLIRMMRFLPAYGLGGILNTQLRKYLKEKATQQ